jgi:hypothetical protein
MRAPLCKLWTQGEEASDINGWSCTLVYRAHRRVRASQFSAADFRIAGILDTYSL